MKTRQLNNDLIIYMERKEGHGYASDGDYVDDVAVPVKRPCTRTRHALAVTRVHSSHVMANQSSSLTLCTVGDPF